MGSAAGAGPPLQCAEPFNVLAWNLFRALSRPWGRTSFMVLFETVGNLSKFRAGEERRQRWSPGKLIPRACSWLTLTALLKILPTAAAVISGRSSGEGIPGSGAAGWLVCGLPQGGLCRGWGSGWRP